MNTNETLPGVITPQQTPEMDMGAGSTPEQMNQFVRNNNYSYQAQDAVARQLASNPDLDLKKINQIANPRNETADRAGVAGPAGGYMAAVLAGRLAQRMGVDLDNPPQIDQNRPFWDNLKTSLGHFAGPPNTARGVANDAYFDALVRGSGIQGAAQVYANTYGKFVDARIQQEQLGTELLKYGAQKTIDADIKREEQREAGALIRQSSIKNLANLGVSTADLMPVVDQIQQIGMIAKENPNQAQMLAQNLFQSLSTYPEAFRNRVAQQIAPVVKLEGERAKVVEELRALELPETLINRYSMGVPTPEDLKRIASRREERKLKEQRMDREAKVAEQEALLPGKVAEQAALLPGKVAEDLLKRQNVVNPQIVLAELQKADMLDRLKAYHDYSSKYQAANQPVKSMADRDPGLYQMIQRLSAQAASAGAATPAVAPTAAAPTAAAPAAAAPAPEVAAPELSMGAGAPRAAAASAAPRSQPPGSGPALATATAPSTAPAPRAPEAGPAIIAPGRPAGTGPSLAQIQAMVPYTPMPMAPRATSTGPSAGFVAPGRVSPEMAKTNIKEGGEYAQGLQKVADSSVVTLQVSDTIQQKIRENPEMWGIVSRNPAFQTMVNARTPEESRAALQRLYTELNIPDNQRKTYDYVLNQYAQLQRQAVQSVAASQSNSNVEGERIMRTIGSIGDRPEAAAATLEFAKVMAEYNRLKLDAWADATAAQGAERFSPSQFTAWFDGKTGPGSRLMTQGRERVESLISGTGGRPRQPQAPAATGSASNVRKYNPQTGKLE